MKRAAFTLLILAQPSLALAQARPSPSLEDPRLQTLVYDPARPARLVAFPDANLTIMLLPGDQIEKVTTSDKAAFDVKIAASNDSLNILASGPASSANFVVETRQRRYEFDLAVRGGLAAYLVRFMPNAPAAPPLMPMPGPMPSGAPVPTPAALNQYRLSGERNLLPAKMSDDGERTYIEWGTHQSLPAVFGIGPSGMEEVVDGYMRGGRFTIDRVYAELIFRIDKREAKARRLSKRDVG